MNHSTLRSLGFVLACIVAAFLPHAANAQTPGLTPEQVRSDYVNDGFRVDEPETWWTTDRVTSFHVFDPYSGRVLMVLVYPDLATANAERARIQAEEATNSGFLVPGYGISTWRQNVALVESTITELGRQYAAEQERDNTMSETSAVVVPGPAQQPHTVDLDFTRLFDRNVVNL